MVLDLLEDLAGEDNDRSGAVTNLGVLGSRDVDEDAGGGVDNVEELFSGVSALLWLSSAAPRESRSRQGRAGRSNLHDGGAVVGDGLLAILVHHEQVTAVGA